MNTGEGCTAIVLVNWNAWRDCVQCMDSLLGMPGSDFDLYVVDNASSDGSVQHILDWCRAPVAPPPASRLPGVAFATLDGLREVPVRLIDDKDAGRPGPVPAARVFVLRAAANKGFAAGNNLGMRAAGLTRYSHFWLLNTDTVVHQDALRSLHRRARADAGLGMIGSTLLYFDRPDRVQAMGGAWLDARRMLSAHIGIGRPVHEVPADPATVERRMAYVVGASLLVSTTFVREVGPMQEDYFLYFEELDWAQRALRARQRYRLGYAPDSRVYHRVGASSAQKVSRLADRLLAENRIRVLGRFFGRHRTSALAYMGWTALRHLLRGRLGRARTQAAALLKAPRLLKS